MKESAGLLLYRRGKGGLQVLLAHPGGPYWSSKDAGAWSIPKGEIAPGEEPLEAALREFHEETGLKVTAPCIPLGSARQAGGKRVHAFAAEGDCDASEVRSNAFEMEWPPRSGRFKRFPEIDRAEWFPLSVARRKINKGQAVFLDALARSMHAPAPQ